MQAELTRTVRFCVAADGSLDARTPRANTFAAWPPMRGLGRYYELHVTCRGQVDPRTGYLVNIKHVDEVVREVGLAVLSDAARAGAEGLGGIVQRVAEAVRARLQCPLVRLGLQLTPTYRIDVETDDMSQVQIAQQYEFSAAHRLHAPELSDQENREVFGKCNNPSGHGHNYRFEVTVNCPAGRNLDVGQLDAVVDRTIVQRYDHTHLNVDVPEFRQTNPSVEHIAREVYERLTPAAGELGVELAAVRVWETGKTACTYRGAD